MEERFSLSRRDAALAFPEMSFEFCGWLRTLLAKRVVPREYFGGEGVSMVRR